MKLLLIFLILTTSVKAQNSQLKTETRISGDTTFITHLYATRAFLTYPPQYDGYITIRVDTVIKAKDIPPTEPTQSVHNIFIAKPVITEAVDAIVYHSHGETIIVKKFKDGSAWVQDKTGVAYYSKKYYRRWKRKNVRL